MKKLLLAVLLLPLFLEAQDLSKSPKHGHWKYVYVLDDHSIRLILKKGWESFSSEALRQPVDSFLYTSSWEPELPPGQYMILYAQGEELVREWLQVCPLVPHVFSRGRKDLLVFMNKNGSPVYNLRVTMGRKKLIFSPEKKGYISRKWKEGKQVSATSDGITWYFTNEDEYQKPSWRRFLRSVFSPNRSRYYHHFNSAGPYERKHAGFIMLNKPVHKPGDTLRLKAMVSRKNGRLLNKPLALRTTSRDNKTDSLLAIISPYGKGGYDFEMAIPSLDKLPFKLDQDYMLSLTEPSSKGKILLRKNFRIEEYELKALRFEARASSQKHAAKEPVSIFMKGTDENDLPVQDGSVHISIRPQQPSKWYGDSVVLKDILWEHRMRLETIGETKLTLPDSIFPRASFDYTINCVFTNSDNESHQSTLPMEYRFAPEAIHFRASADSLFITADSSLKALGQFTFNIDDINGDVIDEEEISLPFALPLHPMADEYSVWDESNGQWYVHEATRVTPDFRYNRATDSVFLTATLPAKNKFWYRLMAGKKLIKSGYASDVVFAEKSKTPRPYQLEMQYIWKGELQQHHFSAPLFDKKLTIQADHPMVAAPGEEVAFALTVTDVKGNPVENADITAASVTSKFKQGITPTVPYFGKTYKTPYPFRITEPEEAYIRPSKTVLPWDRWAREMNLDSSTYYNFLHSDTLWLRSEAVPDSVTQFAPFVIENGRLKKIVLVYVDGVPIYFSEALNLNGYSFPIRDGRRQVKIRTLDETITVAPQVFSPGRKTFLGVNLSLPDSIIRVEKSENILTASEKLNLARYLIVMDNNFKGPFAYLRQFDQVFLLQAGASAGNRLCVGPISGSGVELVVSGIMRQYFDKEQGFRFEVKEGLIKQRQLSQGEEFSTYLSRRPAEDDFTQFVLTEAALNHAWENYLDVQSSTMDHFYPSPARTDHTGKLHAELERPYPTEKAALKNILLLKKEDPSFIRIYGAASADFGALDTGMYRLCYLFFNNQYMMKEDVRVLPDATNHYTFQLAGLQSADSFSTGVSAELRTRMNHTGQPYAQWQDVSGIRNLFNGRMVNPDLFTRTISGLVKDRETGEAVLGASVSIEGLAYGTSTGIGGVFRLRVPEEATLLIRAVGYEGSELRIGKDNDYEIQLSMATASLEEVVVVGYGVQRKASLTGSVSVLSGAVAGLAVGRGQLRIRGNNTMNFTSPLIIIDGIPFSGDISSLDPELVKNAELLKDVSATGLYGSAAANGVMIITTTGGKNKADSVFSDVADAAASIRKNFRDDAFWFPRLRTNKEGKVSFKAVLPDDITLWKNDFVAFNDRKQTGWQASSIRAFKALSAQLAVPAFAVAGDSINLIGKTMNYQHDTVQIRNTFLRNREVVVEKERMISSSHTDTLAITVMESDSVRIGYLLQKPGNYTDGEERKIPVYPAGTEQTEGLFLTLRNDTGFTLDPAVFNGDFTVHAETSAIPVLLEEIKFLNEYRYLCNEQAASKLKGLLLEKNVRNLLKQPFKHENEINKLINRLTRGRSRNLLWGWWPGSEPEMWISLHVVEALLMAEEQGFRVELNKKELGSYLLSQLENDRNPSLHHIKLLQRLGVHADEEKYIAKMAAAMNVTRNPLLYLQFLELKQAAGMKIPLDSLFEAKQETIFGNYFWGKDSTHIYWNEVQTTLAAYRIFQKANYPEDVLDRIRHYFLEKRRSGQWKNTYESASILTTVLPGILKQAASGTAASLLLTGKNSETAVFPYTGTFHNETELQVKKTGMGPVYFTAYKKYWNTDPEAVKGVFSVETEFLQNNKTIPILHAGQNVTLKATVKVVKDAEYVMVEIPIPAGCSYAGKPQPNAWGKEVHREYFKEKLSIFCKELPRGDHVFSVELTPRFTGVYHLNPAKAEMMYFPVFYGREGMKKITLTE